MKTQKILQIVTILLMGTSSFCSAQFTRIDNPWGFAINNSFGTYSHHFFDVDSNKSMDHVMSYASAMGAEFMLNFNKSNATSTPNFSNCTNETFMNYFDMTDSIYGLYQPGFITLGSTSKFFDIDSDGDQDIISSALTYDINRPDDYVTAYMMNENNKLANQMPSFGFDCLYYFDETVIKYNLPAKVSTDSIAVHIFDIGHITKAASKDIIALELGDSNAAPFVLYQDTSTGKSPSYLARQDNPFGLTTFTADNPNSMPLLIDADADGDNDIMLLAGPNTDSLSWYFFKNTGTVSAPNFSTPVAKNPFGLTTFIAGTTQDNLIVLYKIDGNRDGKDDIIFGNNSNIFYFENNYQAATPAAIAKGLENKISIYPNPAADVLHIDIANSNATTCKIIDARGNMVCSQKMANQIAINHLVSGVYHLLLFNEKNVIVARNSFVKQ
jgi:Secretion system C-terminal sorting domain